MGTPALRFTALERPRLDVRGADGKPRPLTLLFAPAGMGKTVLAVQWARSGALDGFETLWVDAPEAAGEAEPFWSRCREVLDPSTEGRVDARAKDAVRRLISRLKQPTMLIIDDFQNVSSSQIDMEVAGLLELSEHLYLTVISRRFSALEGPLVTSQIPTTVIRSAEFEFTEDETRRLAALYDVDREDLVGRLQHENRGWPLAVRLALQEFANGGGERELQALLQRLVRQRLEDQLDDREIGMLTLVAACPHASIGFAMSALKLGDAEAHEIMASLCALGLMNNTWHEHALRLECHPGFGGVLRQSASEEYGAEELRELRHAHALDLVRDDPGEAVRVLLSIGHYDDASRMVARNYIEVAREDSGLLQQLQRIPLAEIAAYPILVSVQLILGQADLSESKENLDLLHSTARESAREVLLRDDPEMRISATALLIAVERMQGEGRAALQLALDLEQRLLDESQRSTLALRRTIPFIHAMIGLTGVLSGDVELGERAFTRTLKTAEAQGSLSEQLRGWNGLALVAALAGGIRTAEKRLARAEQLETQLGLRSPHLSWVNGLAAKMLADVESGDPARVEVLGDRLVPLIERAEQWPILAMADAACTRVRLGNYEALALLRRRMSQTQHVYRPSPFFTDRLKVHAAELATFFGDYSTAGDLIADLVEESRTRVLCEARLELFRGEYETAIRHLEGIDATGLPPRLRSDVLLCLAVAKWQRDDQQAAVAAFEGAVECMSEHEAWSAITRVPYEPLVEIAERSASLGGAELRDRIARVPETLRCVQFEMLTPAETRTLGAFARGAGSIADAAEALFLSQNTVKFHLRSIYRKLRVTNRDEAVLRARRTGLLRE